MPRAKFQTLTEQMYYILLCLHAECYGMDIMDKVPAMTGGRVKIGAGTLYNLLEQFLDADMIRETKSEGKRRCYILTDKGRELLAGFPLVNGVKSFLKKKKIKASANKALTFAASFALAFALTGALTAVTISGIRNSAFESDLKELPFTIGDLLDVDDSDYLKTRGKEDSIILGQYRSSQHPNTYEHSPTMQYTITEVKLPFLYDFVVDTLYHHYDEWKGWSSTYEYVETDATAWGASKAWERYRNGESDHAFLVCYEEYILEISVDWELTAEQKQTIGNVFLCEN